MNYFSYIDNLDLTIEDIINFSPYKLKEVSESLSKYPPSIKNSLEDASQRSYHVTIESNIWLKHLLLKDFNTLKNSSIHLDLEHITYVNGFKLFLENYLKPILPEVINFMIDNNEYKTLFNIINQSDLFSTDTEKVIIQSLEEKIHYATNYLKRTPVFNLDKNIKYIKSYHFYETINLYEDVFKDDLVELYDNIIEIHEQYDKNSLDPVFSFTSQCQVAFRKSQIDDVAVKLFVDNNAENAKEYAYQNPSVVEKEKEVEPNSLNKYFIGGLTALIIFTFVIIRVVGNMPPNKTEEQSVNPDEFNYQRTKSTSTKKERKTYDNRIRFYYSLKRKTNKGKITSTLGETELDPFSNPYPKTFNLIVNNSKSTETTNTLIANRTSSDLIVFKMVKGKDESIYIPKNKEIYISLNESDSILFYNGKNFLTSKFSHFREDVIVSEIYRVRQMSNAPNTTITLTPTNIDPDSKIKLIPQENIKTTNNIKLSKMNINRLYRAYYDTYVN